MAPLGATTSNKSNDQQQVSFPRRVPLPIGGFPLLPGRAALSNGRVALSISRAALLNCRTTLLFGRAALFFVESPSLLISPLLLTMVFWR